MTFVSRCPACKEEVEHTMAKSFFDSEEGMMVFNHTRRICKGCGHQFPLEGNIVHGKTTAKTLSEEELERIRAESKK